VVNDRTALGIDPTKQRRVAEHYLIDAHDTARLHKTVALAAHVLDFPLGQINILDDEFMYTIGDYRSGGTVLPREESMCQFAVDGNLPVLAVDDLCEHPRYRELPGVRAGFARSYLGVQLMSREATPVGTLCLLDRVPRRITAPEIARIQEFGDIVQDQLELFRRHIEVPWSRETSAMIARALAAGEIGPWYQPIMDLESGQRVGFEALARWRRADGSFVSPAGFVSTAEDSDLVIDLDRAVVRSALRDLARWQRSEPTLRMNVNLSTRHLELPDGAAFMAQAVAEAGVDPSAVNVEITESRSLADVGGAAGTVRALQLAGFQVILDDFANGWSGLDWLLGLGPDGVKIDHSLTAALGTRVGDAVSRAVVSLTAELGITTTIEGITDVAHLDAAREHGFRYGQGYLWSTPVPGVVVDATI
jgi:EAL domain-containing protein (putative c-di-GMP-specific phosphodiesterase class I)